MKKILNKIADFLDEIAEWGGEKRQIIFLIISGIALILSVTKAFSLPFDIAWVSVILCGIPIVLEALCGLLRSFDIKADVLVAIALIASICIGEDFAAGEVAFIMQLGELLEELTVSRARAGIEKLVKLTPQTARVIEGDEEKIVPAEQVKVGDLIRVLAGETVPVDGVVTEGSTSVNQAVMTGESLPVDKTVGDEVKSGTVNQFGTFVMRALKVGEDSSIQRMIKLVKSADAGKAKIVGIADRWATYIVIIALAAAGITWAITGEIIRAVTILVVFCPCSLVLATPTAIMAAIGNLTKRGFLVKEGDALERISKVKIIAFDKTGTITYGNPEVIAVKSFDKKYTDDNLYYLVASAEKLSEHPLGKAVVASYKGKDLKTPENFGLAVGKGVYATVDNMNICAGNAEMMKDAGIKVPSAATEEAKEYLGKGCTVIYAAADGEFAGIIALSDKVREESAKTVKRLLSLGITPVLLTGDNYAAAKEMAEKTGIESVRAECLPEDKLSAVKELESRGDKVLMIGDGINDAPALKTAHVGVAMGGVGSDVAIDAADIALVDDEVKELPHLIAISRRMMKIIKINIIASMAINFVATALAIAGVMTPVIGALVHNLGSFIVILNSAFLLTWKSKYKET